MATNQPLILHCTTATEGESVQWRKVTHAAVEQLPAQVPLCYYRKPLAFYVVNRKELVLKVYGLNGSMRVVNCKTIQRLRVGVEQSLVDGSFVCQTSQFKLVEKRGCCERL